MTSIIENELLRELITIAQSRADNLAVRKQTKSIKWVLAETNRIIAEATALLPAEAHDQAIKPYSKRSMYNPKVHVSE